MAWRWHRLLSSVRTQIIFWLAALISLSIVISIVTIRQILSAQMLERIHRSLDQEIEEIQRLVDGRDPLTGKPFGDDVAAIFDVFLSRNVPENDEYLIAFLNGELYKSSPIALPENLQENDAFLTSIAQLESPHHNRNLDTSGNIIYSAHPIQPPGNNRGVFIVAYSRKNLQSEIDQAVLVATWVIGIVFLIALVLAWGVIGRVVSPLKLLTETARSIHDLDHTPKHSIPVKGPDEISELTITFNKMLDRLHASFASQREFINDASHEFQTPITVIRGHLEVLGQSLGQHDDTLDLLKDELNRMSRLVDDLLLLARAERPDFLNLELVDVHRLTEELFAKAQALAARNWQLTSKASIRIVGDRYRIIQAVMNLLQNAAEHTDEMGMITLSSKRVPTGVCFTVCDTGTGISPEHQERVMQRFSRVETTRSKSKGAGLGLSIVKAIAEAHGGHVALSSKLGQGCQFNIIFPLDPPYEAKTP
ncbi:sensor histidine kinase [Adonisia turfae]|uniref:histidine kinase n=1 Tax=Adonisia turfae CCMR0081 TaxID=2292702 RepID=A0A6M0RHK8_9CYAN|nr:HAMP domain-containing sensor histidine kinase [Adonisia turfae]NEZ55767.1 sensor histidine kinase [Adonisia turfae CCMR0081]